jgi:hypothetical protein
MANGAVVSYDQMRIDYLDALEQNRVGNRSAEKRLNYVRPQVFPMMAFACITTSNNTY